MFDFCRRGNKRFDVHFRRIRPVLFLSKDGKDAAYEGEMDGKVLISRQSRNFAFVLNMIRVLFPICTSTWRGNNYVSRQGKGVNGRNESNNIIMKFCIVLYNQFLSIFQFD